MTNDPLAKMDERIEALHEAVEEIREETRRAHEATRDLRQAQKDMKDLMDNTMLMLATTAHEIVTEVIDVTVDRELAKYTEQVQLSMDRAVESVGKEFDRLADVYLYGENGDDPLPDLMNRKKARAKATTTLRSAKDVT